MAKKFTLKQLSLRFFPWWDDADPQQVIGLVHLTSELVRLDPNMSTIVEIGTHIGESVTIFLGFPNFKKIYCVDPYKMNPLFEAVFKKRLSRYFGTRCFPIKLKSSTFAKRFNEHLDMVYIDGDHEYKSVKMDLKLWYEKLKPNGFICGHDYNIAYSGSKKAIDEFIAENNLQLNCFEDSSWYARKI